ncbi:MAG: leucyl aminopeptidase family protein, partial [Gammaproteobacteria bacterium]|nr:leucyl aminopeptidase family protein [Gammaproteobacteria bacterium]
MTRHGLVNQTDTSAAALIVVPKPDFDTWRSNQSQLLRDWLESIRFSGDAGALTWLPPAADGGTRVLVVTGNDPLTAIADLPFRLPVGGYRLESALSGTERELAMLGWGLGAYRFTRYKKAERVPATLDTGSPIEPALRQLDAITLVRDLINTPAADMLPSDLANESEALAARFDARCEITVGDALLAENFPTIHAVGRASTNAPRLIDIRWGKEGDPALVLIGKGVCFDSGGLDIKGAANMRFMKKDMGGAAHALGLAQLVMANGLPV